MEDIPHNCYFLLCDIIKEEHLDFLYKIILTLALEHQSFILHALDKFEGNIKVIEFFEKIIASTDNDYFKEEIEEYLTRIKILEK